MAHLSLVFLGAFQATLDNKLITGFESNKARALLTYLTVTADQTHPRETLAGLLWPDFPNRAALTNLRNALSNLRDVLHDRQARPPFLLVTHDTIQFNPVSDFDLDISQWQTTTANELPLAIRNSQLAIQTYRGRFLEGFACDSAPFEEWVLLKREEIGQQILRVLRQLTTIYDEHGEYDQMQICVRKQLELEPWDEEAQRQLMRALAASGQRGAALAQYETGRRVLKQELGVEPSRETIALYEKIRDGTLKTRAPTNVPLPLTSFVGREREIRELREMLGTARLLTLTGAGGCGKTRLALQVATELANANHYKGGVWWINLAALNDPALVPQTVASVFGLRESPSMPIIAALTDYLRAKESLLVLDNCEHLTDACAQLTNTLLCECPRLQILATSRHTLGIGEVVWRVPSLALAEMDAPFEQLSRCDAIQLFTARATAVAPNWKLAEHAAIVGRICARLDGIPLAIELTAAHTRVLTAQQIAGRLDDRFSLLTGGSRAALPRHQTLRATMDWSYELLSDAERSLLRRLSVFAGGFTLEAVESVCGEQSTVNSMQSAVHSSLLDSLTALVDKSLVVVEVHGDAARYRLLEMVCQYSQEKLIEAGEVQPVRNRHLEFFVRLAENAEPQLRRAEQVIWLNRLELEHDNLRAALAWSLESGAATHGLGLAGALREFWHLHGYLAEGREWLERTLARSSGAPAAARAKAIMQSGFLALQQGAISQANALGEKGLAQYRELGDHPGIAESLLLLGTAAHFLGNDEQASVLLRDSLALFQKMDDRYGCAYVQLWIARGQMRRGENTQAATLLEASLVVFRELGDKDNMSFALGSLGDLARHRGDYARAADLRKESLRLAWEIGSRVEVSYALEQLAMIASASKAPERATKLWGATEVMRESINRSLARSYETEYHPAVADARAKLGEERFATVWAEGRAMTLEQAIDYALKNVQCD